MEFILDDFHRNTPDEDLIGSLRKVAELLKRETVTIEEYDEYGKYHSATLKRRFGSWFKCLELAGLEPSRSKIGITNKELFDEIQNVWMKLGKQPSYAQMRDMARFSIGTYENRFGGWRKALIAFVDYINGADDMHVTPIDDTMFGSDTDSVKHETSRSISLRTRFLVLRRDNFRCCCCGVSPATDTSVELHIDHIKPWSKGGESVIDNLQTLCSKCNLGKSNLD